MNYLMYDEGMKIMMDFKKMGAGLIFHGEIYPFESSEDHIAFSIQEILTPPSEGRERIIKSNIYLEIERVNHLDIDQFIKAVNSAKERLNKYHSLYLKFKEYDVFINTIDEFTSRKDYESISIFLCLSLHRDDESIDEVLIKLLKGCSSFTERSTLVNMFSIWGTNAFNALEEYCRPHTKYNSDFSRFLLDKLEEFELSGLIR